MEKTNENGQEQAISRGEKRVTESENFSKSLEHPSNTPTDLEPTYDEQNSGLDSIISEATATKDDERPASAPEKAKVQPDIMPAEQAAGLAVAGLQQFSEAVGNMTGKQLEFGSQFVTLFAMATTPLIQKYSRHINLDVENIDLDSWMPEILGVGGLLAVGGSTWWQLKQQDAISSQPQKTTAPEGDANGD